MRKNNLGRLHYTDNHWCALLIQQEIDLCPMFGAGECKVGLNLLKVPVL